jgi:hypothetical protein
VGSIPTASIRLVEPKMKRDNRHIAAVIEPTGTKPLGSLAGRALWFNDHPAELLDDVPRKQWPSLLREMQRQLEELEARQTPEQKSWTAARRVPYLSTLPAAHAIVQRLRS